jgi:hypothetical protein
MNRLGKGSYLMSMKKLSAGDFVESRCTRCRTVLNHTIVAMVGERVVRVECNTCHGIHNYIGEKKEASPGKPASERKSAPVSGKGKKEPGRAEREEWESLRASMEGKPLLPYDMGGRYRVNDLVEHSVFGTGIVLRITGPSKMEVHFQSGKKLLRCF